MTPLTDTALTPQRLADELHDRNVVILAVTRHDPTTLVVYLHGNAGQWVEGTALRRTARIPGVIKVTAVEETPTILMVEIDPPTSPV